MPKRGSVSSPQINARLGKHRNPREVLGLARYVHFCMSTSSALFPSPPIPLSRLEADVEALAAAETKAATKDLTKYGARDAALRPVLADLRYLCAYVQWLADNDPPKAAVFASHAGMTLAAERGRPGAGLRLKRSKRVHCIDCITTDTAPRAVHHWAYSIDGGRTWIDAEQTSMAKTTLGPFTPGLWVMIRHRPFIKTLGDWCDPIGIIVT